MVSSALLNFILATLATGIILLFLQNGTYILGFDAPSDDLHVSLSFIPLHSHLIGGAFLTSKTLLSLSHTSDSLFSIALICIFQSPILFAYFLFSTLTVTP